MPKKNQTWEKGILCGILELELFSDETYQIGNTVIQSFKTHTDTLES